MHEVNSSVERRGAHSSSEVDRVAPELRNAVQWLDVCLLILRSQRAQHRELTGSDPNDDNYLQLQVETYEFLVDKVKSGDQPTISLLCEYEMAASNGAEEETTSYQVDHAMQLDRMSQIVEMAQYEIDIRRKRI